MRARLAVLLLTVMAGRALAFTPFPTKTPTPTPRPAAPTPTFVPTPPPTPVPAIPTPTFTPTANPSPAPTPVVTPAATATQPPGSSPTPAPPSGPWVHIGADTVATTMTFRNFPAGSWFRVTFTDPSGARRQIAERPIGQANPFVDVVSAVGFPSGSTCRVTAFGPTGQVVTDQVLEPVP